MSDPGEKDAVQVPPFVHAPPTVAGALGNPCGASTWPTVVGVISIVIAAWGVLVGIGGVVGPFTNRFFRSFAAGNPGVDIAIHYQWYTFALGVVNVVMSVALIVLASWLMLRRPGVGKKLRLLGWIDIARVIAQATLQGILQATTMQAMATSNQPGAAMFAGLGPMFGYITFAIVFVLWMIFPIFLVVWFGRGAIRDEMAQWGHGAR